MATFVDEPYCLKISRCFSTFTEYILHYRLFKLGACDTGSILSPILIEQKLLVGAGFKTALTNEERSNVPFCQKQPKAGLCHRLLGSLFLLTLLTTSFLYAEESSNLNKLKAAYLYNFGKFIEWPAGSFADPSSPFMICLVGSPALHQELLQIEGRTINSHNLKVVAFEEEVLVKPEKLKHCQLIYAGSSNNDDLAVFTSKQPNQPILTVGENKKAGIISFYLEGNNLRFNINLERANAAGLQIGARLLRVAQGVQR